MLITHMFLILFQGVSVLFLALGLLLTPLAFRVKLYTQVRPMSLDVSVDTRMLWVFPQTRLVTMHILLTSRLQAWLYVRMLLILMQVVSALFLTLLHLGTSLMLLISWVKLCAWLRPILPEVKEVTKMMSALTLLMTMHAVLSSIIQAMPYAHTLAVSVILLTRLHV